ncbi:MAG: hypothetical protein R3A10_04985 [Caldilineaceae bacterium]
MGAATPGGGGAPQTRRPSHPRCAGPLQRIRQVRAWGRRRHHLHFVHGDRRRKSAAGAA